MAKSVSAPSAVAKKPVKGSTKSKSLLQDESIMGTNNSSIVSKRSVERLYYPKEQFFRPFVKKVIRRAPLINRGYWLRMRAIDQVVRQFLEQFSEKPKIVINLGCGYDPLPWQCLTRYKTSCQNTKFIDIDYQDLMLKKKAMVETTEDLKSLLTNVEASNGNIILKSDQYFQIGCDLRDLEALESIMSSTFDLQNSLVLLTAEVSITYMNVEAADALISWASRLPQARFCLLEQLIPDGVDHPFSQTMMAHFNKLQTPLRAVEKYPTTSAQESRFHDLGWPVVSVCNLWKLWSLPSFVTAEDREHLDSVEPFDEWEEFALFGCHYFLLVADTNEATSHKPHLIDQRPLRLASCLKSDITTRVGYSEYPKAHGYRRFAAGMVMADPKRDTNIVGVFGGMGLMSRENSYDIYSCSTSGHMKTGSHKSPATPSNRMCHTITDLGDVGSLLVGGRTSPDNALFDCWVYHKWLNVWERVDDIPHPLYRHQAAHLGKGFVIVSTGRIDSRTVSTDFLLWSRKTGWLKCAYSEEDVPFPTYGATFAVCAGEANSEMSDSYGILAGGISSDSVFQQELWRWDLTFSEGQSHGQAIISFRRLSKIEDSMGIARFGASVVNHQGQVYVIGGIIFEQILGSSNELCAFKLQGDTESCTSVPLCLPPNIPRPFLTGNTVVSVDGKLVIMGGSAVCFSFGTFWNKGCFTVRTGAAAEGLTPLHTTWNYLQTIEAEALQATDKVSTNGFKPTHNDVQTIPRVQASSTVDFEKLVNASSPVVLEGLDIGSCPIQWTAEYLKNQVGSDREVTIHQATAESMNFKSKNFTYVTMKFGDFMDRILNGEKLYLRSLSLEKPSEKAADIALDFSTIAADFKLPPELKAVTDNAHSSPLRISGPVKMWLHYDVMANVLCQIRGTKKLLLFPPTDFRYLDFEPGASSSPVDVFEGFESGNLPGTHPYEGELKPGEVLFLPPLWLHSTLPTSDWSISVNVFFRSLSAGYAAGKDVYGNRDLQAYEKGRQDIAKVAASFDKLPADVRDFYLQRLIEEFKQKGGLA